MHIKRYNHECKYSTHILGNSFICFVKLTVLKWKIEKSRGVEKPIWLIEVTPCQKTGIEYGSLCRVTRVVNMVQRVDALLF